MSGEPVPTAKMQAEQQLMALEQQKKQIDMEEQQQELAQQQAEEQAQMQQLAEEESQEEGGEENSEGPFGIQAMQKAYKPPSQRKFKGRTGGVTPDWSDKHPDEERDIDEYAEARANKNELTLSKTWIQSLSEKGFAAPVIKQISPDLNQMWFSQNNIDYIANLSSTGVTTVEKAMFGDPTRLSRNKQEKPKATAINMEDIEDE